MRRSIWIPLVGVVAALAIILFIFVAAKPDPGPVAGDVATGNGVVQNADGTVGVDPQAAAAPPAEVAPEAGTPAASEGEGGSEGGEGAESGEGTEGSGGG